MPSSKLQVVLSTDLFTDKRVRQKGGEMDNLPHSKPRKLLPRQRKQGTSWRQIAPRLGQVPNYKLCYLLTYFYIYVTFYTPIFLTDKGSGKIGL